jgi:hypothetical protein
MKDMRLFHYTKGVHVPKIVADGEIRPSNGALVGDERPIVWLSSNAIWENSVWIISGKDEAEQFVGGWYRFVLDVPAYTWERLRFLSNIHPRIADSLENVGRKHGANPIEWYGTFWAIPSSKWLAIEVWRNGQWQESEVRSTNEAG